MSFVSRLSAATLPLALGSLVLSACPASADVLFSSLPFVSNNGYSVNGSSVSASFGGYIELAAKFTPSQTARLDSIQIPFFLFTGDSNPITISVYNSVNNLPGSVLATQTIPAGTITIGGSSILNSVSFGGSPTLTFGSSYFVDASTTGNSVYAWNINQANTPIPDAVRTSPNGSFFASTSTLAFQVNGTPLAAVTPEPGSVALLIGITTVGAGFLSRRRRQQAKNAA